MRQLWKLLEDEIAGQLTIKDVVVVWGGTWDVGRNETEKGLYQIKNFAINHNHTNVIVMSVPYRYDLESKSCVNNEVKVYNRKLKKHLKVFSNTCVIEVDSNRDLFTRHGLHMNSKGKEQTARQIVKTIWVMLNEKKSDPIIMKDKEASNVDSERTQAKSTTSEIETNQKNLKRNMHSNELEDKQMDTLSYDKICTRSSIRQKKTQKSMSNDFLWQ
jgi:RNase H-fold protein (predicted Holliday junction resolvase)